MAVVFMEGWDAFNANTGVNGLASGFLAVGAAYSRVTGKDGIGGALRQATSNTGRLIALLDSPVSQFTFVTFVDPGLDTDRIISLYSNTTEMVGWRYSTDGSIGVYRGSTLLGSSAASAIVNDGNYHLLEVECVIDDSAGRFTVYWDGTQILNLTSQDTRNGAPTTVDRIIWNPAAAGVAVSNYDHTFVTDSATKPTEQYYIETISVNADGSPLDWTPSTGSDHFAVVDELPVGTTDYLQASTVGNIDELVVSDLSSSPTAILAAKADIYTIKTDVTLREMRLGIKSGATTSAGTSTAVAQTGTRISRTLNTDPNTGAAWTESAIEALRLRPEVTV